VSSTAKLLVVGPAWVGDMVMAQSLYKVLRMSDADVTIDVLAPGWSLPVLARMPEVRRGIELATRHGELGLGARRAAARRLRAERYDRAIVLPRSLKAALVPFLARIPVRTGFRGEWRYGLINDMRPFDAASLNRTVLRFVALGAPDATSPLPPVLPPALEPDAANLAAVARRLGLDLARPAVALMPGAEYGPAKRWPAAYFARLASALLGAGCAVWVLGSAKEQPLGREIAARAGAHRQLHDLTGATSLADVVDLLSAARVAVSNDSGLMHVAAAVGTHVAAIYGSSSPAFTPPLTEAKTIYYADLDCSPCFERVCPLHHLNCLKSIRVDAVLAGVMGALVGGPGAAADGREADGGVDG
jgi:heptosyltransferase-2